MARLWADESAEAGDRAVNRTALVPCEGGAAAWTRSGALRDIKKMSMGTRTKTRNARDKSKPPALSGTMRLAMDVFDSWATRVSGIVDYTLGYGLNINSAVPTRYGALAEPEGDCTCKSLLTRTTPGTEALTVSAFCFTSAF